MGSRAKQRNQLNKVTAHSIRSRTINSEPLFSLLFSFEAEAGEAERRGENTFTTIQPFGIAQLASAKPSAAFRVHRSVGLFQAPQKHLICVYLEENKFFT
jgi:hypothetical protein